MSFRRHHRATVVCGLVVSIAVAGCAPNGAPGYFGTVVPPHPPNEIWINNSNEPEYLDPGKLSDSAGSSLVWNMFAGLVQAHPQDLAPMPDVARSWDVSPDGTVFTFKLRDSQWSDGRALTASDFEWSWKRVVDPATASKYGSMMYVLRNAAPVNQRALWVRGVAWETGEEEEEVTASIAALFEEIAPVERVATAEWPERGAFVYLGGETEERAAYRDRAIEALDGRSYAGGALSVEVAGLDLIGVRALDDHTLEARLEGPIPYFINLVTFYTFLPVPRHLMEQLEAEGVDTERWTKPEHIVSNGAYNLVEHHFRYYYLFEKNPRYWDAASVRIEKVKTLLVESYNTSLNLYRAGEFDWSGRNGSLPSEFMAFLEPFRDFQRYPYGSVYFYWINTEAPPLDNAKLRRALSMAIDRQSIVDNVAQADQTPTADLVPDGLGGYEGLGTSIFDPEGAREVLREAGYASGADVPSFTLTYNTSEGHRQIAEAVQQMWKDHLGVEVQIENQEWKVYLKNLQLMDFEISRMGWILDYADPYTFLELLSEHNGNNHSNWSSPEYDELLLEANTLPDPAERLALFRKGEAMVRDAAPLIPFYVYTKSTMIKPYLMGFWGNYQDRHPWKYFWIDERWYDGVPEQTLPNDPPAHTPFS
ncbi:MAG: ABC transporter substrate-binding protein [Acidobacteriota bacterium]|nr:ABC transporter substrate-binding protein [Acidobacteriota bacterium]